MFVETQAILVCLTQDFVIQTVQARLCASICLGLSVITFLAVIPDKSVVS